MPRRFGRWQTRHKLACSVALGALAAMVPALWSPSFAEDDPSQPRTTFGTVGLVDMPSARMAPDGQLSAAASFSQHTERFNLGFQALPWLETSIRYTGISHFQPAGSEIFSVYWDRSFAAKVRIFNETDYTPAFAVGVNDLIGTGVYSSEFLTFSKRFGTVDTTVGIGWGRLGSSALFKNPLTSLSQSFSTRPSLVQAGGTNFNVFFHGPSAGVFGGATWHTPIDGLLLSVEYSSDKNELESTLGTFTPNKSQINYGISYQPFDTMTIGLAWMYGKTVAGTLSFQTDPTTPGFPGKIAPTLPQVHSRTPEEQLQALETMLGRRNVQTADTGSGGAAIAGLSLHMAKDSFADRLMEDYGDVQIVGRSIVVNLPGEQSIQHCRSLANMAQSYGGGFQNIVLKSDGSASRNVRCDVPSKLLNVAYTEPMGQVIDASGTQLQSDAAAIKTIKADLAVQDIHVEAILMTTTEVVINYNNQRYYDEDSAVGRLIRVLMADAPARIEKFRLIARREQEFDVLRTPMERAFAQNSSAGLLGGAIMLEAPSSNDPVLRLARQSYPRFNWNFTPQFRQSFFDPKNPLAVQVVADLDGEVEIIPGLKLSGTLEANLFDNYPNRASDSLLPHVRSDSPLYVHKGANGIAQLMANYKFRLAPELFAAVKAGYLESMFAGAGGEVLWRPQGSRWAFGADVYDVKQRNYDRLFGLQNYSVVTGHLTAYYQSPWYGLNFSVRGGQYLAGDRGVTVEVSRRFSTGVEIGAFFTKTNVSAERFGEGSFDKGIIIRIPLGWALPIETQAQYALDLRPIQRDGGQTLAGDATLYGELFRTNEGEINGHADAFVNP